MLMLQFLQEGFNHCQWLARAPSGHTEPIPADNLILSSPKLSRIDPLWRNMHNEAELNI